MEKLPSYLGLKLAAISIKQFYNDGPLAGIQMFYSDGSSSPMFETSVSRENNWKIRTIDIAPHRKITSVSVNVYHCWIRGLRLVDSLGKYLVNTTWCTDVHRDSHSEW